MRYVGIGCLIAVLIGSLNLFIVGLYGFNIIEYFFKSGSVITRIIYTVIGVCGNYLIGFAFWYKPFKQMAK